MFSKHSSIIFSVVSLILIAIVLLFNHGSEKEIINKTIAETTRIVSINDTVVDGHDRIILLENYNNTSIDSVSLLLSGTYGSVMLSPETSNTNSFFRIPARFTKYAGVVDYCLIQHQKVIQKGSFKLLSNTSKLGIIDNYLGPRTIVANERDYTMLVSIPTDHLDNLLPDRTAIKLKTQFQNSIESTSHELAVGFAWKRINAPLKIGRISTGSTLSGHHSKELGADVFPDIATDFSINAQTNHNYADGNETITLRTTQIKDEHNNIITDGTRVTFFIKDTLGGFWQTTSNTVNGFAFAKALHPQTPSIWKIKATIKGITESREIEQVFEPVIAEIPISLSHRKIVVGPLTSYMGQLVQDGIDVSLRINEIIYHQATNDGKAIFLLNEGDYPKGEYQVYVETLGVEASKTIAID